MNNIPNPLSNKLVIIGDNFISRSLYNNYKRYGKFKLNTSKDINQVKYKTDYIIDCSFNERTQNSSLSYCKSNDVKKILLINHWKRLNLPKINTTILQSVLYEVYGPEHNSFCRSGPGNYFDSDIKYCTFISESIRRIHESKINNLPILRISYGENKIKFIHIDRIYDSINFMLTTMKVDSTYSIYDEERYSSNILNSIQEIIDYQGEIIFKNTNLNYTQPINNLKIKTKKFNFDNSIRRIYKYLLYSNPRFSLDLFIE